MLKPERLKKLEDQREDVLLALLGFGEARGEPYRGMIAVMWVAVNRMEASGKMLREVILAPKQFSCFNQNDPNFDKLMLADQEEPVSWGACAALARSILDGLVLDPTHGATHYYATSIQPPSWAKPENGWKELGVIGNQVFGTTA